MAQIKDKFAGGASAYMKHNVQMAPNISGGFVQANAAAYEQYADLLTNIIQSGDLDTVLSSMKVKNVSQALDVFDRTDTNFLNSLGSVQRFPTEDLEFYYPVEDIDSLKWTASGSLQQVAPEQGQTYFIYGKGLTVTNNTYGYNGPTPGNNTPVFKLTDLIPETDPMFKWLRKGMVIREQNTLKTESIRIVEINGELYGVRGSQVSGLIIANGNNGSRLPVSVTQAHAAGAVWVPDTLAMNEFDSEGPMIREGWTYRHNLMGMYDFYTNRSWLEKLITAVNNPMIGDPIARAKDRMLKRINEIWNYTALFGTKKRISDAGKTYYYTGGIINEIKMYCTERWGGADTLGDGYFPWGADTTNPANFVPYKCNGNSNYRVGKKDGEPNTPAVFSQALLEEADYRYRMNAGINNEKMLANTIYLPSNLYRIATQFDEGRVRTQIYQNAISGYQSIQWLSPMGTLYKFVREDNLKNAILIGNPENGKREALASLLAFDLPTKNPGEAKMYVSIQGFSWKRPEYLWFLWENVTEG